MANVVREHSIFVNRLISMQRIFTIISLSIILSCLAWCQNHKYTLTGKVISNQDGKPLIGANILIKGTYLGAATDQDGRYTIIGIRKGRYNVQASFIGCESLQDSIFFDTITEMQKDFYLESSRDVFLSDSIVYTRKRGDLELPCHLDASHAKEDIENRTIHLVINSGIVGCSLTQSDKDFEKKYGVRYDIRGCTDGEPEECLDEYYKIVFPYLDKMHGKWWKSDANKMWLSYLNDKWK